MKKLNVREAETLKTTAALYPWFLCFPWPA
jgi:hypothetical protein